MPDAHGKFCSPSAPPVYVAPDGQLWATGGQGDIRPARTPCRVNRPRWVPLLTALVSLLAALALVAWRTGGAA